MEKLPTRSKEIATIWAIAKSLNINSEYLHVLVYSLTNCESIAQLNTKQRTIVITHLKKEQAKQKRVNEKNQKQTSVFLLPTPAQRYTLDKVMLDLVKILNIKDKNKYLEAISMRMYQKSFEKLDRREYGSLIKNLLEIKNKTQRRVSNDTK